MNHKMELRSTEQFVSLLYSSLLWLQSSGTSCTFRSFFISRQLVSLLQLQSAHLKSIYW